MASRLEQKADLIKRTTQQYLDNLARSPAPTVRVIRTPEEPAVIYGKGRTTRTDTRRS